MAYAQSIRKKEVGVGRRPTPEVAHPGSNVDNFSAMLGVFQMDVSFG
jgi:hypothetical protein